MTDEKVYYAPDPYEGNDRFHILREATDIYGACGDMVNNSNDAVRDRRPGQNVCPKCDKIMGREEE